MANYYSILGLPRTASVEEIRDAYRRQAIRYHPDHNPETIDAARFREIQEAYEVLGDPRRKRSYDRQLEGTEGQTAAVPGYSGSAWSFGTPRGSGDWTRPPVWPKDAQGEADIEVVFSRSDVQMLDRLRRILSRLEEIFLDEEEGPGPPGGPVRW